MGFGGGLISNKGLMGQTALPYPSATLYAGSDGFFDLQFVDHTLTPVTPLTFTWQLDDLTNCQNMVPPTSTPVPTSAAETLQIPGAQMIMTYPYQSAQICQLSTTFTALDSVTGNSFTGTGIVVVQLIAIQTPDGTVT